MARPQKLLTPGPTSVPPEVLRALSEPVLHHRSPDFAAVFEVAQERLREVFRTENEVLLLTSSGTGAFESAVVNLLSPGERVLAVSQGEFGERWQALAGAFGCDVVPLAYAWGESPRADDLREALEESGAETVFLVHSETSTGVVCELEPLLASCRDAGAVSIVDAVSSLGAVPLETDAWGADVVVTGSQKALMTPPGLAFAAVSERAWERSGKSTLPRFYWDWARQRRAQAKGSTPFTPATSNVVALVEALGLVLADGLDAAFARHRALGRACRAGVKAIGLQLYSPDDDSAAVLTGALTPQGIDAVELRLALRDRHGITIAGGHGDLVQRLFRIGHIGHVGIEDIAEALTAIEEELRAAGAEVEPGRAAPAALEAFGSVAAA
ncbi:MAG TPA: alanine--glyoxylate aminotransferase family protein [Gaiella sp.]|uniref:pyridoxal-phosphate-dependent aminotransferase family protein n=1 Tax=Gaiella sp. TaxID=2663207 RepID=UPI002D7E7F76|nr:alanine--glyoxylate aminotransferase family protein [Gaiella sp.]HET9286462.1 alanine--glyoxylate aminotransferase family protein [Gaiella sp.]